MTNLTTPPWGRNSESADKITTGNIEYPTTLVQVCKSKLPVRPANMLKTTYRKIEETTIQPSITPNWIFPASNWKRQKDMYRRIGPDKSESWYTTGFTRNGLSIDLVFLQIWSGCIPSSSSRGSSSSKLAEPPPPPMGPP
ncbi:hypothetical protein O6P43_005930 [Quillaja saponaria]|uniref:Uncharacterized protein n=1 Tax=Quillaja saponaria TaxID=32244 RepID=A0AAD7Q785_QUISA|nr:hypothetical protein O6P43_005930 [Quillaja saponaria]